MDKCARCGKHELQRLSVDDSMEVAGHTFSARLPARRCPGCGDVLIEARDLMQFERAVALELARSGQRTGGALQALRRAAGLTVARLAELADVPAEAITAWEEEHAAAPAEAAALLRGLVVSKLGNAAAPMDLLALLRLPRQLARRVRLSLDQVASALRPATA